MRKIKIVLERIIYMTNLKNKFQKNKAGFLGDYG